MDVGFHSTHHLYGPMDGGFYSTHHLYGSMAGGFYSTHHLSGSMDGGGGPTHQITLSGGLPSLVLHFPSLHLVLFFVCCAEGMLYVLRECALQSATQAVISVVLC